MKAGGSGRSGADLAQMLAKAPEGKMPPNLKPMTATLVDAPFDKPGWTYEVKWDGYRALAGKSGKSIQLTSRNNLPFSKFFPVTKELESLPFDVLLDGEIVVLNESGISDFGALQNWKSEKDGNLVYFVFDLLWLDGHDLSGLPLNERQVFLELLPLGQNVIRRSEVFAGSGIEFFAAAEKMDLEGIMAKRTESAYASGLRSRDWLKIKVHRRQEVVIAGFTKNEGTGKYFSSLILGVFSAGRLRYVGKVGTGFPDKLQKEMLAQFKPLVTTESPFDEAPDLDKGSRFRPKMGARPTWLKPDLVCEVAFAEITSDGLFRQASFKGMRIDKKATDVVLEVPKTLEETQAQPMKQKKTGISTEGKKKARPSQPLLADGLETQSRKVCGNELTFTHLSKIYWPKEGISKRDMFEYYHAISPYIIPYLKDRPMSLNRFPNGIEGPSFYQKDISGKAPEWITHTFPYTSGEGDHKEYLVCKDEADLLWMASLGCIEMNPWFSRATSPDNPDFCVIDLDPDKNTFDQVVEVARAVKEVLDEVDVPCYPKTSGSTGMHIYIPLAAKYSYEQSQLFARIVVGIVHRQFPTFTSLERMISNRKGKMYLDFLQNRPGATIAGAYSLRPKPGATVSMPLAWDEVKPGIRISDFNIFNALDRLKETGDLFAPVLGAGINLEKTLAAVEKKFHQQ